MDEFGYLSVLVSVILGLAVAQILKGFRGLLLSRARIRIYWPVIGWAALLLLICFQSWWAMFELRHYQTWTFAAFAVVLLQTIVTYMLAGLVFPDFFGEGIVDLRESFYAHRRVDSIKKRHRSEKIFRGGARLNKLAQLDGGAAVCSGARQLHC